MKALILCGGIGMKLQKDNSFIPKGMIKIGHRPMLWHIMKTCSLYGIKDFILALGKGSQTIREYFLNYNSYVNDVTVRLKSGELNYHTHNQEEDWHVTLVETGDEAGTGARISRCEQYIDDKRFIVTYSDCLANVDITKLIDYHIKSGKIATITGIMPPYRYGEFVIDKKGSVKKYNEISKLHGNKGWVNGGYMIFEKDIFRFLNSFNECILETTVFKDLSSKGKIALYMHKGFWQCLDNQRELNYLNSLCENNSEPWLFINEMK